MSTKTARRYVSGHCGTGRCRACRGRYGRTECAHGCHGASEPVIGLSPGTIGDGTAAAGQLATVPDHPTEQAEGVATPMRTTVAAGQRADE